MGGQSWFETELAKYRDDPEFVRYGIALGLMEAAWARMEAEGISQAELARRMGVSRPYITKLLRGTVNLTLNTIIKLAIALDVEVLFDLRPCSRQAEETIRHRQMPVHRHARADRPARCQFEAPDSPTAALTRGGGDSALADAA